MKKIISILLILTIFSSLFLLTACDDSTANNTNIIPEKANYIGWKFPSTYGESGNGGVILNAEPINDNYLFVHLKNDYINSTVYTVILIHKAQASWSYLPEKNITEKGYNLDKMKNLICEEYDCNIYVEDGFLVIEHDDGTIEYLDQKRINYSFTTSTNNE